MNNNNIEITNQQTEETINTNTLTTNQKKQAIEDNVIQTINTYDNINTKHNTTKSNLTNDSFDKLILTLKDKIHKNKTPYKLTKHNNNTTHSNKNQHTPSLSSLSSVKMKQLISMIVPLEQCSSPQHSLHQQQQSTLTAHYNTYINNSSIQSTRPQYKVTPRTSLIKPKKETLQTQTLNHIIPLISNSFSPKFVTAQDKRYKIYYTSSKRKSHNEHTFHSITTRNTNIDDILTTNNSKRIKHNTIKQFNKDSLLKELESFDNKLFNSNTSNKNVQLNRKKRSETKLITSSDRNNHFYNCFNIKPQEQRIKFNRLKLNI